MPPGPPTDDPAHAQALRLSQTAERLGTLIEDALRQSSISPDGARHVLSELAVGLEDLRVAEEELIVQSAQLAESYAVIEAERERYGALFEFAPDGYLETDLHGKILEANSAASRLLGVPTRFLVGKILNTFIAVDDRRALRRAGDALAERESGDDTVVVEIVPRDASKITAEIRISFQREERGHEPRLRWLIRDITERLKLERELGALHTSIELLTALANISRLVVGDDDGLPMLLQRLVTLARQATGADAAVMLIDPNHQIGARAVAGPSAGELCDVEAASGGPALEVLRTAESRTFTLEDLASWAEVQQVARAHGINVMAAFPIPIAGRVAGVFTLYGTGSVDQVAAPGALLAENAASAIANAEVYRETRQLVQHLNTALESRGIIDQAKGILMATQHCGADEAFDLLRRASQRENRKLRDIAHDIVERASRSAS